MDLSSPPQGWGLLPSAVKALVLKREWHSEAGLKARLLNRKPFPIRIGLKPPTGRSAVDDLMHFQTFIRAWQSYPVQKTHPLGDSNIQNAFRANRAYLFCT